MKCRISAEECWRLADELDETVNQVLARKWRVFLEEYDADTLISVEIDTANWDDALASSIWFYEIQYEAVDPGLEEDKRLIRKFDGS